MEVNSALMVQDLKDAETNLVVVDLFKYSMESICFIYTVEDKPNHIDDVSSIHMRHVTRKPVYGGVRPGKTQTGLLSYRS